MDRLCMRCARPTLKHGSLTGRTSSRSVVRSFSSTSQCSQDTDSTSSPSSSSSSSNQASNPKVLRATRSPRNTNSPRPFVPRSQLPNRATNAQRGPGTGGGGQLLQRSRAPQQDYQRRKNGDSRSSGQVENAQSKLQVRVRYADGKEADVPVEQLLRPGRGFREPEAVLGTREEIINEMNGNEDATEAAEAEATVDDGGVMTEPTDADIDEYITKHIDRPANPTEPIPYQPTGQTAAELQKDWPDTPMSSTGLTATLVQKIELLARRIPHGYQTPEQIAEHFRKGNLTRFESDEEKEMVLKIAQELAQKRADKLTERKGEQVTPADMTLSDLSKHNDDKKTLVDSMVRGDFGDAQKQRMPFLDSIVRNLRNNSTYHSPEMAKFMTKVESLIPAQAGNRRAAAAGGPKQAQRQS